MNTRDSYKKIINYIACIVLIASQIAMFAYTWYTNYRVDGDGYVVFAKRGYFAIVGIYILIMYFFTKTYGGYKISYLRISDICLSQVLAIVCTNFVTFFEACAILRDYIDAGPLLILTAAEIAVMFPWVYLCRRIFTRIFPPRKMLVVYDERSPQVIVDKINSRPDKYHILEVVNIKEGRGAVINKINEYEAVVLCDIRAEIRNDILKYCFDNSIRTYTTPKLSDIIVMGSESIYLFDSPLLLSRNNGLSADQLFVKRVMDIVISALMLIVTLPFMLIVSVLIKAYDGGPVFYFQERLTINGRKFNMIKFRSMKMDSEKDGVMVAKKNDDRVTPVGRLLRRIHFDELPQIINVFKGDMSFVGPRPERQEIADMYSEKIPEFGFRLKVKAGLTGYAQVYGRYNTTPYDKLKMDLTYIQNYSVFLDIKIILATFKVLFQKDNTQGFDENKLTPDNRVDTVKKVEW
jgi:exopolysaccharide biosynthesis polyprenyl glycosylphosphotransferase